MSLLPRHSGSLPFELRELPRKELPHGYPDPSKRIMALENRAPSLFTAADFANRREDDEHRVRSQDARDADVRKKDGPARLTTQSYHQADKPLPSALKSVEPARKALQVKKKRMLLFELSQEEPSEKKESTKVTKPDAISSQPLRRIQVSSEPPTHWSQQKRIRYDAEVVPQRQDEPTTDSLQLARKEASISPSKKPITYGKRNSPEKRKLASIAKVDLQSDSDDASAEEPDGKQHSCMGKTDAPIFKTPVAKKRKLLSLSDATKISSPAVGSSAKPSASNSSSSKKRGKRPTVLTPAIGNRLQLRPAYELFLNRTDVDTPSRSKTSPDKSTIACNKSFAVLFDPELISPAGKSRQRSTYALTSSASRKPLRSILHLEPQWSSPVKDSTQLPNAAELPDDTQIRRPGVLTFRRIGTDEHIEFGSTKKEHATPARQRNSSAPFTNRRSTAGQSTKHIAQLSLRADAADHSALTESPLAARSKMIGTKSHFMLGQEAEATGAQDANQIVGSVCTQAYAESGLINQALDSVPAKVDRKETTGASSTRQLHETSQTATVNEVVSGHKRATDPSQPITFDSQIGLPNTAPAVTDIGPRMPSATFRAMFSREEIVSSLLYNPPQYVHSAEKLVEQPATDQRPSPSKRPLRHPKKAAPLSLSNPPEKRSDPAIQEAPQVFEAPAPSTRRASQAEPRSQVFPQTPAPRLSRTKTAIVRAPATKQRNRGKTTQLATTPAKPAALMRAVSMHNPALQASQIASPKQVPASATRALSALFSPQQQSTVTMSSPVATPRLQQSLVRSKTAFPFRPPTLLQQTTPGPNRFVLPRKDQERTSDPSLIHMDQPPSQSATAPRTRARTIGLCRRQTAATTNVPAGFTASGESALQMAA